PLKLKVDLIGERPTGETRADSPVVEVALEATRALGVTPRLDQSSTDSNLPISLGIPAITLGAGGSSGASHSLDEWYDPRERDLGLKRGLLVILGIESVADPALPGGNRFCRAILNAFASPPEACVTRPDSS